MIRALHFPPFNIISFLAVVPDSQPALGLEALSTVKTCTGHHFGRHIGSPPTEGSDATRYVYVLLHMHLLDLGNTGAEAAVHCHQHELPHLSTVFGFLVRRDKDQCHLQSRGVDRTRTYM